MFIIMTIMVFNIYADDFYLVKEKLPIEDNKLKK